MVCQAQSNQNDFKQSPMNVGVVDRPIPPRQIATLTHCQEHHQLRYSALMCHQILRTDTGRNVWQSIRRVYILSLGMTSVTRYVCCDSKHQCRDQYCVTECFVFQYIVMNSVEERMLSLQEQKRTLMGQAFGLQTQSQEERRRARVRDIKHLIGL